MAVVHAAEIRVLGTTPSRITHAHLMRLVAPASIPGDDRGIDAHCLGLLASGAILIGAYVQGVMRASAEIRSRSHRAPRRGRRITIEDGFYDAASSAN